MSTKLNNLTTTYFGLDFYIVSFLLIWSSWFVEVSRMVGNIKSHSGSKISNIIFEDNNAEFCYEMKGVTSPQLPDFESAKSMIKDGVLYHFDDDLDEIYIEERLNKDVIKIEQTKHDEKLSFKLTMTSCVENLKKNKAKFNQVFNDLKSKH